MKKYGTFCFLCTEGKIMSVSRRNKLFLTAALMLLSQVVLAFFMVTWLKGQYYDEQDRLRKDLLGIASKTEDFLIDSVIRRQMATTMKITDDTTIGSSAMSIQIEVPGEAFEMAPGPALPQRVIRLGESSADTMRFERMKMMTLINNDSVKGSDSSLQEKQRTISMFIRKLNTLSPDGRERLFRVDSLAFQQKFRKNITAEGYPFNLKWVKSGSQPNNTRQVVLMLHDVTATSDMLIGNTYSYLFRMILPQIGFSLVLLLLTGLSFGLSYTTLRRQIRLGIQKDDFISNMSHELKTPVATAKVALEALRNYNALDDPQRAQDYLQMASWEMDRLEVLITRVLNAMQLEEGKMVLLKEPADASALVTELVGALQPRAQSKGTELRFQAPAGPVPVFADKMHLQGAVYNLLDNALKYGGDRIDVTVASDNNQAVISVVDNGPGIPEEYSKKIFEKFFRIPQGNVHDVKGYGLGLNYTRYVARAHGGSISQHNAAEGGAVFTIVIPATVPS